MGISVSACRWFKLFSISNRLLPVCPSVYPSSLCRMVLGWSLSQLSSGWEVGYTPARFVTGVWVNSWQIMIRIGKLNRICWVWPDEWPWRQCVIRMYPGFNLLCKFYHKDLIICEHNSSVGVVWRSPGNVGIFLEFLRNYHVFNCFYFYCQDTHILVW